MRLYRSEIGALRGCIATSVKGVASPESDFVRTRLAHPIVMTNEVTIRVMLYHL